MKIKRVRIENYRCLHNVDIPFDEITCFVGPTGAGKSTVLRALDWFFNGEKTVALSDEDVHSAAESGRITVEVEFDGLTDHDREALGSYAPPEANGVIIWRTWEDGEDKITARKLAYAPFQAIRAEQMAMGKRRAYSALRDERPDLGLPSAGSAPAVEEALRTWELENRDQLTETEIESTHFFGFAGQSKLTALIDFVFISADLRAYEEADDHRASALGRILDHAVDRTDANEQLGVVEENAHRERLEIHTKVYGPVLDDISAALSYEVAAFTTGRQVLLAPVVQPPKAARTTFRVSIRDGSAETSVYRQGHGFQRALIIAALKFLAERRRLQAGTSTLCLAIEEPELYQHPAQAKTFAEVLRELAASSDGRVQAMYATHSPVFVDHRAYWQIRRLDHTLSEGHPTARVSWVTESALCEQLPPYVSADAIRRSAGIKCADTLAEGFFARAAVLVEGPADVAVITGCAQRSQGAPQGSLGAAGISVINAGGKGNLILCHAILKALNVPCHVVFDGDGGKLEHKLDSIRHHPEDKRREEEKKARASADEEARKNTNLLGYLGAAPTPRPDTVSTRAYTVFSDDLEGHLHTNWPAWEERKRGLISSGDGFSGKNPATYREAARTAVTEPPLALLALLENVRALASGQ